MAKPRGVDAKLNRLWALRREPAAAGDVAELRQALSDRSSVVVEAAASIVGDRGLSELADDLAAAFDRFMVDPIETDPKCRAKNALVDALNKIDYPRDDVFLRGLHHTQEHGPPGQDDPAAPLRGRSALGLARISHPGAVLLFVELFFDPARAVRVAAAQALGETRSPTAIPLLRFKARKGDKDAEVTGACLAALMASDADGSLPFVAAFLGNNDEVVQGDAALALGESRRPDALEILIGHWPRARDDAFAEVLLLAIAMTRLPAALDFLLDILSTGNQGAAAATLSDLFIHRHNEAVKARIAAVVADKGDAALVRRFHKKFGE
jgi:HEAT repeat protein